MRGGGFLAGQNVYPCKIVWASDTGLNNRLLRHYCPLVVSTVLILLVATAARPVCLPHQVDEVVLDRGEGVTARLQLLGQTLPLGPSTNIAFSWPAKLLRGLKIIS